MSTNKVGPGFGRLMIPVFLTAHKAGDLVYENGFYGVMEEDVAAGARGYICISDTWRLKNTAAAFNMGVKVSAPATSMATTLPIGLSGATAGINATVGWNQIGRVIATGIATAANVMLFQNNAY